MTDVVEPAPFDPDCRRWLPDLAFPAYRFLPGQTPRHPTGATVHAPGREDLPGPGGAWRKNHLYLAGIDHFNFAYWWEAHEFWESLWRNCNAGSACRKFLQGLIQLAAGLLKWHQGNERGMAKLAHKAADNLHRLTSALPEREYMGLDLVDLRRRVANLSAAAARFHHSDAILKRQGLSPVLYLGADRESGCRHGI